MGIVHENGVMGHNYSALDGTRTLLCGTLQLL